MFLCISYSSNSLKAEQQKVFEKAKTLLVSSQVLIHFSWKSAKLVTLQPIIALVQFCNTSCQMDQKSPLVLCHKYRQHTTSKERMVPT